MKFTLNFEEEVAFLSVHTNCTFEEALGYVQTEDDYYDTLGLNSYPSKNGLFEVNGKCSGTSAREGQCGGGSRRPFATTSRGRYCRRKSGESARCR